MKRQKRKDSSKTRHKAKVLKLSENEKPDSAYNSSIDSEDDEQVDELGGAEDVASPQKDDVAVPAATGAGKAKIVGLYKPPTHEELQTLKETENLFQSNLMRMQITELLAEVKPKKSAAVDEFLHRLRDVLTSLPPSEPVDLCEALTQVTKTIRYPLRLSLGNTKGKFKFLPPSAIKITGSYLLQTLVKPDLNVDVVMVMPEECLQVKDLLNCRYLHKRALYLCHVAAYLKKKKGTLGLSAVTFSTSWGDPLRPILVLKLKGKGLAKYSVRLHTSMPERYFKASRLAPDKGNIRRGYLTGAAPEAEGADGEVDVHGAASHPTPHYNTALLCEMGSMEHHLHTIYTAAEGFPGMTDAVVLCKVWARQRGLDKGRGGFSGFHFAMLLTHLLELKQINKLMSSYQIVRVVFQYLADWPGSGIAMERSDPTAPSVDLFKSCFDVIFIDSSGFLNICSFMSADQLAFLKHEAAQSLRCLDDPAVNGFEAFFMKRVPFVQQFDVLCHIDAHALAAVCVADDQPVSLDATLWPLLYALRAVMPVIIRGLGKRVTLVTTRLFPDREWPVSEESPDFLSGHVTLGMLLDAEHACSLIDMGPSADSSEASEFRMFWGDKSELRRFQDASINEAVVWNGRTIAERRTICHQVIQHLLHRHAQIEPSAIVCSINVIDQLLSHPAYQGFLGPALESSDMRCECTGEEVTKEVLTTFEKLSKELRQLRDLPLAITSLQPISAVFRHAEAFPPLPWNGKVTSGLRAPQEGSQNECFYPSCDTALPPYVPALEVICQLEASGKWPDELEAIRKIKTAFYIKMHKLLGQGGVMSSPTVDCIDILMDGFVFRLRIHYPRELSLMREELGKLSSRDADALQQKVALLQMREVFLPLHTSTLNGLHQQYTAYGNGVRLCKRWAAAHLLSNHLSEEAIELVVARLFVCPAPCAVPGSAVCVLLRFLNLIAHFDWASEPLIVNLNHELKASDLSEISARFNTNRAHHPPMFIATSYDKFSSCWTRHNPTHPVVVRTQLLAKESLALLSQQLQECGSGADIDFLQAFRTPLQDYNVLLHLHKKMVVAPEVSVASLPADAVHPHVKRKHHYSHFPIVDFNAVEKYIQELERFYSEFGLFFYDKYGGSCVAVAWKPRAFIPHLFKASHVHCRSVKCYGNKDPPSMVTPDVKAVTGDLQLLGEGLVKSVEVLSDPAAVGGDTF